MRRLAFLPLLALLAGAPPLQASPAAVSAERPSELAQLTAELRHRFGPSPEETVLLVDIASQRLSLVRNGALVQSWPVSTSLFGVGNRHHSERTPLGAHRVAQKFGAGAPLGTLFRARRNTGEVVEILTDDRAAAGDYVTTRILWLQGLEPGLNRGPGIDSYERYIYIHGTAEEGRIGRPASRGCVRMRNADVVELFEQTPVGALVLIRE